MAPDKNKKADEASLVQLADDVLPPGAHLSFDNDGNIVIKNRAYRRQRSKLPGANQYTKKKVTKADRKKQRKLGRK